MNQIFRLALALFFTSLTGFSQSSDHSGWKVIGPGGGGTTIAPTISPHDARLVVEHSDMTGAYVTHDNGLSWHMFNLRGGNQVFAFDPVNPRVIYAGNAALWRSSDAGLTWAMVFPNPGRNTIENQIGDHSDYSLTSDDPAYPGGDITAIAVVPGEARTPKGTSQRVYVSFQARNRPSAAPSSLPAILVSSADGGATWNRLAVLPQRVLLLVPQKSGLIAFSGSTAYAIGNDGSVKELGSLATNFKAVSAARSSDSVWIYATGRDGLVYLSEDSGLHWRSITPDLHQCSGKFEAIATSDLNSNIAYVGFRGLRLGDGKENLFNGIAKSTDAGRSWKIVFKESIRRAVNLTGTWIESRAAEGDSSIWFDAPYSLSVAPTDSNIVYASDLFRTYRTLDGGATWLEVNSKSVGEAWTSRGLDVTSSYGVQFDPFDSRHIYMDNTDIGLFQSADGGRSWQSTTEGVPDAWRNTTYWVALDPAQRGLVWGAFSGTHDLPRPRIWRHSSVDSFMGGVGVSTDGGRHWQPSNAGLPSSPITHILLDPSSPVGHRTLYACAFGHGVYKSTDNGKSWSQKNSGIFGAEPLAWRITPAQDGTLYLVVARRGEGKTISPSDAGAVYRSVDKAESWQRMELPPGVNGPTGLEVDPRDAQRLYLTAWGQEGEDADRNGGVYVSEDGGKTWLSLFTASQHVYDLTIDLHHPDTLYICGYDAAAFRSVDRGLHWQRINGYDFKGGHRVFTDPNDTSQIYITTYGGGVWHGPAAGR
jgi:photosystem II stability/assembly factor-like uncharacterized protein